MIRTAVHFIDSAEFGGAEQAMLHLLAGLDRRRWRPVLFHHSEPGLAPLLNQATGLNVKLQEVPRIRSKPSIAPWLLEFRRELRAERPAVFHAHLNGPLACQPALLAATLARVPAVVATVQLFVKLSLSWFIYAQQRFLASRVDRYIAVSDEVAARLRQTFHIPAGKLDVVHNGIWLTPFTRSANHALKPLLMGSMEKPIVLTSARLSPQKGHRYLLEAAALVPEAVFVLAGDGPERMRLEAQARQLGLTNRVLFLGYRQDIPDLLACCDLFVLPSLFEGLPLCVLEAMTANKPVIATAVGGTDEVVVHGETGLLVPPADAAALASAIRMVLSDPSLAQRLAATGKARVDKEFSAAGMVQRVTHIYDQILSSHQEAHGRRGDSLRRGSQ
jgi:glycosyltransferase involved in cell wall biosynthesis